MGNFIRLTNGDPAPRTQAEITPEVTERATFSAPYAGGAAIGQQIAYAYENGDDNTVHDLLAYERSLKSSPEQ